MMISFEQDAFEDFINWSIANKEPSKKLFYLSKKLK